MKKTNIITIAVLAVSLLSSVAHAGNFFRSNPGAQGIAIPGLNHIELTPLSQCQLESSSLKGQLNAAEEDVTALQDKVRELQGQVNRLTPGTCENACSGLYATTHDAHQDAHDLYTYDQCVESCTISKGFIDRDNRTADQLFRR